jgi:hypothetical protein
MRDATSYNKLGKLSFGVRSDIKYTSVRRPYPTYLSCGCDIRTLRNEGLTRQSPARLSLICLGKVVIYPADQLRNINSRHLTPLIMDQMERSVWARRHWWKHLE